MVIGGSLIACMKRVDGFPKRATAATWSDTSGGIGAGTSNGGNAIGDNVRGHEAHDRRALRESTEHHLGLGQFAAVASTCVRASAIPSTAVGKSSGGGVVDRVNPDGLRADPSAQRVDERLSRGADTGCLGGAAGENHLGIRARRCADGIIALCKPQVATAAAPIEIAIWEGLTDLC